MPIRAVAHRLLTNRSIFRVSRLFSTDGFVNVDEMVSASKKQLVDEFRSSDRKEAAEDHTDTAALVSSADELNEILDDFIRDKHYRAASDYLSTLKHLHAFNHIVEMSRMAVVFSSDSSGTPFQIPLYKSDKPDANLKATVSEIIQEFLRGPEDPTSTTKLALGLSKFLDAKAEEAGKDNVEEEEVLMEEFMKEVLKLKLKLKRMHFKDFKEPSFKGMYTLMGVVLPCIEEFPLQIGKDILKKMMFWDVARSPPSRTDFICRLCKILAIVKKGHLCSKEAAEASAPKA